MAESDPTPPIDAAEAAYRDALLADDSSREQRRARLMAALPRPGVAQAVPAGQAALAWRWHLYAPLALAAGLLLAAVLVLRGRSAEPRQDVDPRLAAGQSASAPTVLAQANAVVEPVPPATAAPRPEGKAGPARPRAAKPPPVVVADATPPQPRMKREAIEPVRPETPPPAAVAVQPQPRAMAEAAAPVASQQAQALARVELGAAARAQAAHSLAASGATDVRAAKARATADAALLTAVTRSDAAAVRAALQAGASAQLRDEQGRTVLMLAARAGTREVVELLLAAGSRRADRDPRGWTAADHADAVGHAELVDLLR